MDQASSSQLTYIAVLVGKLGQTEDQVLERLKLKKPISKASAGSLIRQLKIEIDQAGEGGKAMPSIDTPHEQIRSSMITPEALRKISNNELPAPANLSEDASWILYRLAKLADIEQTLGDPVRWPGVNQGGPITVQSLVDHFGNHEAVALAFKVSIGTVKSGWGAYLPQNRGSDAELLTRGYVKAPR